MDRADDSELPSAADDSPEGSGGPEEEVPPAPLVAFAHRHRLTIGITVAAVMVGLLAWSLLTLSPATVPGFYGVVQRFSFPLMCLLIGAVGITWGLNLPRRWINLGAYAAIGTYFVYLATGWIYESFIA